MGTQTTARRLRREDREEQLLPGLPYEFTLDQIIPKLSWRTFHILSFVSRAWQQAIGTREVCDARVRSHATETLVVLNDTPSEFVHALALFSIADKLFYQLPQFPFSDEGIPESCQCICLDGKVYVLGGGEQICGSREVYVLDLPEQREWGNCASMKEPRRDFGCRVKCGKIYVFGGISSHNYVRGCEANHPKLDAWSSITPMKHMGVVKPSRNVGEERLFTAQGKLYLVGTRGIFVGNFDDEGGTWSDLHSFSFRVGSDFPIDIVVHAAYAVNDELLAFVDGNCDSTHECQTYLLQSTGFDSVREEIMWEKVNCPLSFEHLGTGFMCPIEL